MRHEDQIDFVELGRALLDRADQLVPDWLPGGDIVGNEYVCADLSGGKGRSCSVNLTTGRWADFSSDDRGVDLVSLYAASRGLNNGQAAREIMRDLGWEKSRVQTPGRSPPPAPRPAAAAPAPSPRSAPRSEANWKTITPVPANTPRPSFEHYHRGQPALVWEYRFEGELYGYVCRFTTSEGGKEILPYTWCEDTSDGRGTRRWSWKQWDGNRPLYVPAGQLSPGLDRAVVLVEGEKCAEAGHKLLGDEFDFVSWPGGSKAWAKAGWGWLMGRAVILWPDCDAQRHPLSKDEREKGVDPKSKPIKPEARQPGMMAMVGIGSLLVAEFGCTVSLCKIPEPGAISEGWDIADAIEQGWTADQVRAFIRGARGFVAPDDAARAKAKKIDSGAGAEDDEEATLAWRSRLLTSTTGATKAVRENVVLALDGAPDEKVAGVAEAMGVIAYNEFTNDVVKLKPSPWGTDAGNWLEVDDLLMGEWLVREHWLPSMPRGTLEEAVRMVAHRHRFHPVREYLQGLVWDRVPRLRTWLRRACLEEDEWDDKDLLQRYLAAAGTYYLMGMVQRAMEPGCKFDYMLVLESPEQGRGKSSMFRLLGGEWFADTGLVLGDKDSFAQLQGRWVYEMSELDALSRADVKQVKQYIASQSDYFRMSYDRRAREYPRQGVFGGTTNDDHYLVDPTGNRRFWPVRVTRRVDLLWLAENRDQLFAEALARLTAGRRYYPSPDEEEELFVPQQQLRMVENPYLAKIAAYLHPVGNPTGPNSDGGLINQITTVDLLGKLGIGLEKLGPGRHHEKQTNAALRQLGWTEGRPPARPGEKTRPRVWRRPQAEPRAAENESTRPTQADQPVEGPDDCPF